ncbi:MAG: HD domain-containing protein [Thermoanaerobaculum sp.]|nr:HD domain-containing protein [Thermoanaerobaculum sp.]MDW7967908.1 HD domain-containing protein [Thermoanaerobaculum sp.]
MPRLEQQLAFLLTADRLKAVQRRNYTLAGRREFTAEHCWHVALAAVLLHEHAAQPVDLGRVLLMLLIHDLVELEAGDTFVYDVKARQDQSQREQEAAQKLFSQLPADQGQLLGELWWEFTFGRSPEARFARSLDRLLPVLLNVATEGRAWSEHGVGARQVLERNAEVAEGSPVLWQVVQELVSQAVQQGFLADQGPLPSQDTP